MSSSLREMVENAIKQVNPSRFLYQIVDGLTLC